MQHPVAHVGRRGEGQEEDETIKPRRRRPAAAPPHAQGRRAQCPGNPEQGNEHEGGALHAADQAQDEGGEQRVARAPLGSRHPRDRSDRHRRELHVDVARAHLQRDAGQEHEHRREAHGADAPIGVAAGDHVEGEGEHRRHHARRQLDEPVVDEDDPPEVQALAGARVAVDELEARRDVYQGEAVVLQREADDRVVVPEGVPAARGREPREPGGPQDAEHDGQEAEQHDAALAPGFGDRVEGHAQERHAGAPEDAQVRARVAAREGEGEHDRRQHRRGGGEGRRGELAGPAEGEDGRDDQGDPEDHRRKGRLAAPAVAKEARRHGGGRDRGEQGENEQERETQGESAGEFVTAQGRGAVP